MTRLRRHPDLAVVAIAAAIFVTAGALLQTAGDPLRVGHSTTAASSPAPSPTPAAAAKTFPVPQSPPPPGTTLMAQVVVYGSTPSGIVAAVSAARAGATVVVISPDDRVGGMMTSGLSHADIGRKDLIGGLPLEVFRRIGRLGTLDEFASREGEAAGAGGPVPPALRTGPGWDAEPHIVQATFQQLLGDANVPVFLDQHLDRTQQLPIADGRITALRTTEGLTVQGDVFIDATYEGDLMAAAGVPFVIGREASRTYGEALAGVRPTASDPKARLISGRDAQAAPLPGASIASAKPGAADHLIQPPTYRLCVTDDPSNRIAFTRPPDYAPASYALFGRALRTWKARMGTAPSLDSVFTLRPLPDRKRDLNNRGLFSTDILGGAASWSTATDAERAAIAARDRAYEAGLLWYLQTSPDVPAGLRAAVGRMGLCKDEFTQTGGWPPELYVREARRMLGDVVLTQRDLQTNVTKAGAIALGTYRIDGHFVRRLIGRDGLVRGEGELSAPTRPYQIPYAAIVPPARSVANLLVSVTISASHVAWASIRTEPTLMAIGQAAGVAAAQAARDGVAVQRVDVGAVRKALLASGAILAAPPRPNPPPPL